MLLAASKVGNSTKEKAQKATIDASPQEKVVKNKGGQVRLNIWQLPPDMDEAELLSLACDFGIIRSHEMWSEGAFKCANLEYETREMATKAVEEFNDRRMDEWDKRVKALLCD